MPAGTPPQDRSSGQLQYIDLADFTAGLTSGPLGFGRGAGGGTDTGVETQHGNGAADPRHSFGCYGHPNGGLHPGPKLDKIQWIPGTATWNGPDEESTDHLLLDAADFPNDEYRVQVSSACIMSPVYHAKPLDEAVGDSENPDDLFFIFSYFQETAPSTWQYWQTWLLFKEFLPSYTISASATSSVILLNQEYDTTWTVEDESQLKHLHHTCVQGILGEYISATPNVLTQLSPTIFFTSTEPFARTNYPYHELFWISRDTDDDFMYEGGYHPGGHAVYHQGRIVSFSRGTYTGAEFGFQGRVNDFGFGYQDPYGDTPGGSNGFDANPYSGVGVMQSLGPSEFLIVHHREGGILVRGDLDNPTVTHLPYLAPTEGIYSIGAMTDKGFAYGTKSGVWLYRGGDSAECISAQLEGFFWHPGDLTFPAGSQQPNYLNGKFDYSYPFLYAPNNFACDMRTGGWFRLRQPAEWLDDEPDEITGQTQQYSITSTHNLVSASGKVYLVTGHITGAYNANPLYMRLDPTQGCSIYRWRSHPLPQSRNRFLNYREVNIVVEGVGTVTVELIGLDGQTVSVDLTFDTTGDDAPHLYTLPVNLTTWDVVLQITSKAPDSVWDGVDEDFFEGDAGPAPVVHRVALGYQETRSTVSTGRDSTGGA